MNASFFSDFPSQLHWNADELAEAVPLRLHQLFAFDAQCIGTPPSANALPWRRPRPDGYLPPLRGADLFRVH